MKNSVFLGIQNRKNARSFIKSAVPKSGFGRNGFYEKNKNARKMTKLFTNHVNWFFYENKKIIRTLKANAYLEEDLLWESLE